MTGVQTCALPISSWKTFIKDHHLEGWTNAYQTEADLTKEINPALLLAYALASGQPVKPQ